MLVPSMIKDCLNENPFNYTFSMFLFGNGRICLEGYEKQKYGIKAKNIE